MLNYDQFINEAASTPYSVGDYFLITVKDIYSDMEFFVRPNRARSRWINLSVEEGKYENGEIPSLRNDSYYGARFSDKFLKDLGEDSPLMICKATRVHPNFVEGVPVANNRFRFVEDYQVRCVFNDISLLPLSPQLKKIVDGKKVSYGEERFFVGDEKVYDLSEKLTAIEGGKYMVATFDLNFSLEQGDLMIVCVDPNEREKGLFSVSYEVFSSLPTQESEGQGKALAEWFSKQIEGECSYEEGKSWSTRGQKIFMVEYFSVTTDYPFNSQRSNYDYNASPFFSKQLAEEHIEELMAKKKAGKIFPFDPKDLEVKNGGTYEFNYLQMNEYIKLLGLKYDHRTFLTDKRGKIAATNFGF